MGSVFTPDITTVVSIVIGGILTLAGVHLTNRASAARLREQFDYERKKTKQEREMTLRKEIYLAAAEAVLAGLMALNRFPNLEISDEKVTEEYIVRSPALSKIHIIGKINTIKALSDFTSDLGATFLKLYAQRSILLGERQKVNIARNEIIFCAQETNTHIRAIDHALADAALLERLTRRIDDFDKRKKMAERMLLHLESNLSSQTFAFVEVCAEESARLSQLLVPLVVFARRELDLELEEGAYAKLNENAVATTRAAIKLFINMVKSRSMQAPP